MLTARVKALLGLIGLMGLLGLGVLAKTRLVTRHDLHVDKRVAEFRFPVATDLALSATASASEVIGIALLLIGVIALVIRGRRWDAARLMMAAGGAWTLGLLVKAAIERGRPPASLWLLAPDSANSFPSGHDTTACAMILVAALVFRGAGRARLVAVLLAAAYAVAVGASRIYLGDHYPTDVIGSWLTVTTAALLVWAATDLAVARRLGFRLLRDPRLQPQLT